VGEAGPADTDLSSLLLRNKRGTAELRAATKSARLLRTVDGASTLTLGVHDGRRQLVDSATLKERTTVNLDGRLFELVQVKKTGSELTVEFEDAAVADLRRVARTAAVRAGTTTRVGYARRIVSAPGWLSLAGPAGPPQRVPFSQDGDKAENGWQALDRLFVQDLAWWRFVDGKTVTVAPGPWLYARRSPLALREHTDGVDDINFDVDAGKPAQRATVICAATRWGVPLGCPVTLSRLGAANGAWLVESIERSLFSTQATIGLTRVSAPLPAPKVGTRETGGTGGGDAGETGGTVTAGAVSTRGFSWPLSGSITSGYGQRSGRLHTGVDIAVPVGTPVLAAADGVVEHAGTAGGYGIAVYLDHDGTDTRYAHLSRVLVRAGQRVRRGDRIALSGNTGRTTGPHLHFEVRPGGRPTDPLPYLPSRR
jgi:hypothetical protein